MYEEIFYIILVSLVDLNVTTLVLPTSKTLSQPLNFYTDFLCSRPKYCIDQRVGVRVCKCEYVYVYVLLYVYIFIYVYMYVYVYVYLCISYVYVYVYV